jgi:hypothetical protein
MRWTPGGTSEDIEDRRDEGYSGGGPNLGGFGGMHLGAGGTIILLILSVIFRQDFFSLFSGSGPATAPAPAPSSRSRTSGEDPSRSPEERQQVQFVSFVLDDAQKTWDKTLPQSAGVSYRHAKLVLFRNLVASACGQAESATGPFYCPGDERVYVDLSFFDELRTRFGAPGEFAQAYVLAHELGHHVQKILGIEARMRRLQRQNPSAGNQLSVRLELQADCFAGIWGHSTEQRNIIDKSDVEAGLRAAAAVGDDRLQKMATGHVSPESFTHGSSAQRMQWFQRGLQEGEIGACDTFGSR